MYPAFPVFWVSYQKMTMLFPTDMDTRYDTVCTWKMPIIHKLLLLCQCSLETKHFFNVVGAPATIHLPFPVQVRMEGTWNTEDSFLLGLMAPDSHCLNESHGFDACDVGYWFSGCVVQHVPLHSFIYFSWLPEVSMHQCTYNKHE